jgi:chromosomal replication initiation ATPase DnaA
MSYRKKQKQVSVEEYIETYCQERRMRDRIAMYISKKSHKSLKKVALIFSDEHHTTISSLAEAIISHHLKAHREMLDEEYQRFLEPVTNGGMNKPNETDSESCPADDSEEQ